MLQWQRAGGPAGFSPGTLDVWLAVMPEGWRADEAMLSREERARAARFVFDRDRLHFRHHHTFLRTIVAGYLGMEPACVPLVVEASGKPALAPPWRDWRFNLSHSGPAALVAVTRGREVGVDIERTRAASDAMAIARRFFSPDERAALEALAPEERDHAFLACWTRKEAFLKATGKGISGGLDRFTVSVDPAAAGPWPLAKGWTVLGLPPVPGYACAACVEGGLVPVNAFLCEP